MSGIQNALSHVKHGLLHHHHHPDHKHKHSSNSNSKRSSDRDHSRTQTEADDDDDDDDHPSDVTNSDTEADVDSSAIGLHHVSEERSGKKSKKALKAKHKKKEKAKAKKDKKDAADADAEINGEARSHRHSQQQQRGHQGAKRARDERSQDPARYGNLDDLIDNDEPREDRCRLRDVQADTAGKTITFRARIHRSRVLSSGLVFLLFREQESTLQGVLKSSGEGDDSANRAMVRWAKRLAVESIVLVTGQLQKPAEQVRSASMHDLELKVQRLHLVSEIVQQLPFYPCQTDLDTNATSKPSPSADQEGAESKDPDQEAKVANSGGSGEVVQRQQPEVPNRIRFQNRVLDLRTITCQAVFRVKAGICMTMRTFLDERNFIEIQTPKLQAGATESGASVFKLDYFGRTACLAQSPQLGKQMCIAGDMGRVFEVGPVFRAENSNTHRHLTEYTGVDLEMAIEEDYHEAMDVIDALLKHTFKRAQERFRHEIDLLRQRFPAEDLVIKDQTPRLRYADGIRMLRESGWVVEGRPLEDTEDLDTRSEIRLGELVKEKYGADYYILDKFPTAVRPFYTMRDRENPKFTNSFDIFLRGQEILTGGQRVHDAKVLTDQMIKAGVAPEEMDEYLKGFAWGAPPHAGAGLGLERIVMLFLNLPDIRHASLFPRDPKSLPRVDHGPRLRHPEASTLRTAQDEDDDLSSAAEHEGEREGERELPPLEKLIANYGDASNTAWLDERYKVWRHKPTGAAAGYGVSGRYAIILGDPLCDASQLAPVVYAFLEYIHKEQKLKPIWMLLSPRVEKILGNRLRWSTLTCVAEGRIDLKKNTEMQDARVKRKIRHATNAGVKIVDLPPGEVPEDVKRKVDERIKDWLRNRRGTQVHTTNLQPWVDSEHRRYFYAQDEQGKIHALLVLAQLSIEHGWQIKYGLEFPGAPSGTSEYIISHSLHVAAEEGATSATFGATAASHLTPGYHIGKLRTKALSHSYDVIASALRLTSKSNFRMKWGVKEDPLYIAFPKGGLGSRGVHALVKFLESD